MNVLNNQVARKLDCLMVTQATTDVKRLVFIMIAISASTVVVVVTSIVTIKQHQQNV